MAGKKTLFASVLAALLLGSQLTKAQGCTNKGPVIYSCNTKTCFGQYSGMTGCPDGSISSCTVVFLKCCNQQVPVFAGIACGGSNVVKQSPIARKTLDLLSNERIQIAALGCDHYFALYRPSADAPDQGKDIVLTRKPLLPAGF